MSKESVFGFDIPTAVTTRSFFAPSVQDAPRSFQRKFAYVGHGPEAMKKLANELNAQPPLGPIIMIGSGRALSRNLRLGDVFLISAIQTPSDRIDLKLPSELRFLPQMEMLTYEGPRLTAKDKAELFEKTRISILDPHFQHFIDQLKPELRQKLFVIRGITETASESLDLRSEVRLDWSWVGSPSKVIQNMKLKLSYQRYQKQISDLFEKMMRTSCLIESVDPASFVVRR